MQAQQELGGNAAQIGRLMTALKRFSNTLRHTRNCGGVVDSQGPVQLIRSAYAGPDPDQPKGTLIFVPSPINPARILDLTHDLSLMRGLAPSGWALRLVDWGKVDAVRRDETLAHFAAEYLTPLAKRQSGPVVLVGYCLGGMIATASACSAPDAVQGLITIAAPWDFAAYPPDHRDRIAAMWAMSAPMCERLGVAPIELLQSGFWKVAEGRLAQKFLHFTDMQPGSAQEAQFIAVEDWANSGEPLPLAMAKELFSDLVMGNKAALGQWCVTERPVRPDRIPCPALEIASQNDAIVPLAMSANLPGRRVVSSGHVGMVVGRHRVEHLHQPIMDWLAEL